MTVYLDIVLLENLCMNYIILFATGIINKVKINQMRIILSSLIGGIYAVISFMSILEVYSNVILKIILSIVMVYLAFNSNNLKILIKQLLIFYLTSFVFGGCAFFLLYFIRPQDILIKNGLYIGSYPIKVAILGGIVGFVVIITAFKIIKSRISKNDVFYNVDIFLNDKTTQVRALMDTGNLLKEPITGIPVMIVEKESLQELLPSNLLDNLEKIITGTSQNFMEEEFITQYASRFRVIPFSSLGTQNGLLLGIKVDYIKIYNQQKESVTGNIIIGIYNQELSKNKNYTALIGLDILERSEQDELVGNIKI